MATILVVDDHADNRHLLRTVLGYCGHEVLEASGGQEGLELARRTRPGLIISDILMPGMDGYQFARELRAEERTSDIPLLLSSAHYLGPRAKMFAAECGVSDFVAKPVEPETLIELVASLLEAPPLVRRMQSEEHLQERHLELIADQLVAKNQALERAVQRLAALSDIGIGLYRASSLASVLEAAVGAARSLTGAAVAIVAAAQGERLVTRCLGMVPPTLADDPAGPSPLAKYERVATAALAPLRPVVVPVIAGGRRLGAIIIAKAPEAEGFDSIDHYCASLLANQLAVAIQQIQLMDALRAVRDDAMAQRLRAERAHQAKTAFLAAASHDLRQPYQAMELFHGVLAATISDPTARRALDLLGVAMAAGQQLLTSLLELSALEAGIVRPRTEAVHLRRICDGLADEVRDQAAAKGLGFGYVPSSAVVVTDPVLLGRMVRNLLSNALKYTMSGRVLLGCRRAAGRVRIEVVDTGPGIPTEQQGLIFHEFVQLDDTGRESVRGLGLGLAVVEKTGRVLGHPVGMRSMPGRGSAFFIEVPVQR